MGNMNSLKRTLVFVFALAATLSAVAESFGDIRAKANAKGVVLGERPAFPADKIGQKYKKLAEYLYEAWDRTIELDYAQIEEILGFTLPATAYNFPQSYWANTETHSYAKGSWMALGYSAKVIGQQKVQFERDIY